MNGARSLRGGYVCNSLAYGSYMPTEVLKILSSYLANAESSPAIHFAVRGRLNSYHLRRMTASTGVSNRPGHFPLSRYDANDGSNFIPRIDELLAGRSL